MKNNTVSRSKFLEDLLCIKQAPTKALDISLEKRAILIANKIPAHQRHVSKGGKNHRTTSKQGYQSIPHLNSNAEYT